MKSIVMTYNSASEERRANAEAIAKLTNGEVFVGGTNATENFRRILASVGDEDLLFFEDDATDILIDDIRARIKEYPNIPTNFFWLEGSTLGQFLPLNRMKELQCIYLPNAYVKYTLTLFSKFFNTHKYDYQKNHYERVFRCATTGVFYTNPLNLVKQLNIPSAIFPDFTDLPGTFHKDNKSFGLEL